jgi:hypothetical protein
MFNSSGNKRVNEKPRTVSIDNQIFCNKKLIKVCVSFFLAILSEERKLDTLE